MRTISKRLKDEQDLLQEVRKLCVKHDVKAGVILSAVGSLSKTNIRVPVIDNSVKYIHPENVEIVSATGTVSINGCHIHLAVSDIEGNTWGGHIKEGCYVRTTLELVIGILDDTVFTRKPDSETGYQELSIE